MACANEPAGGRRQCAKCHVCKRWRSCGFCGLCCHWFCNDCNKRVFARGFGALMQVINGHVAGCCGPEFRGTAISEADEQRASA